MNWPNSFLWSNERNSPCCTLEKKCSGSIATLCNVGRVVTNNTSCVFKRRCARFGASFLFRRWVSSIWSFRLETLDNFVKFGFWILNKDWSPPIFQWFRPEFLFYTPLSHPSTDSPVHKIPPSYTRYARTCSGISICSHSDKSTW